ncbi:hypothetical protein, partial [Enterocloster asparagiformis]|uniref:hypothetical protein n=1 Tax=Enterocloster asparagiformis TaxID=333367 RepID=UPI002A802A7A
KIYVTCLLYPAIKAVLIQCKIKMQQKFAMFVPGKYNVNYQRWGRGCAWGCDVFCGKRVGCDVFCGKRRLTFL